MHNKTSIVATMCLMMMSYVYLGILDIVVGSGSFVNTVIFVERSLHKSELRGGVN